MSQTLTVRFDKPIISAKVLDDYAGGVGSKMSNPGRVDSEANSEQIPIQDLEAQKAVF